MQVRMPSTWIKLGFVGRPHGLKGAFLVRGRDESWPKEVRTVRLGPCPDEAAEHQIDPSRSRFSLGKLALEGLKRPEAVSPMHGFELWARREDFRLAPGEYFWADLSERAVLDSEGLSVGQSTKVLDYGGGPFLTIEGSLGNLALTLVDTFFDLASLSEEGPIRLAKPLSFFEDCWGPA